VISPVGIGKGGKKRYNVNADTAATAIATALRAEKLTILTDVDGVMIGGKLVTHLTKAQAASYISKGLIHGGMIPKVESCIAAVESGCGKAHLVNGTVPHSLLFEIFTDKGVGTELIMKEKK
jgi:acetylglutamate kinase